MDETAAAIGSPISSSANSASAATARARGSGTDRRSDAAKAAPSRQSHAPAAPPARIAAIWPIAVGAAVTMSVATTAMVARGRSGQRLRAMLHTACATTATATTCSPWSIPPLSGPVSAAAPRAKSTMATADGSVKPSQAATPARGPAAREAHREAHLAARRPGQELAEGHQVRVGRLAQPAAPLDELPAVVPQMRDRPAEGREAQAQEHGEDRPDRLPHRRASPGPPWLPGAPPGRTPRRSDSRAPASPP